MKERKKTTTREKKGELKETQQERERWRKKTWRQNENNIGLPYWRDRVITSSDPYLKDLSAPLNIFQLAIRPTPKALFNMLTYIYTFGV